MAGTRKGNLYTYQNYLQQPKIKATQMFINGQMGKQKVV
jgi:hypothetical protein